MVTYIKYGPEGMKILLESCNSIFRKMKCFYRPCRGEAHDDTNACRESARSTGRILCGIGMVRHGRDELLLTRNSRRI